jgi:hypothetical protein
MGNRHRTLRIRQFLRRRSQVPEGGLISHPRTSHPDRSPRSTRASDEFGPAGDPGADAGPPKWSTWREALRVVFYPRYLRRTVAISIVVGTVLFAINQLDVVVRGDATTLVWLKSAVTYLVPFCVSNAGVLVASRRR